MLNYLYSNPELTEIEYKLKSYIDKSLIISGNLNCICIIHNNNIVSFVYNNESSLWEPIKKTQTQLLTQAKLDLTKEIEKNLGNVYGYISYVKQVGTAYKRIIKSKIKQNKNYNNGAICNQSATSSPLGAIKTINEILGYDKYNNTRNITKNMFCFLEEMLLRCYDIEYRDNKRWFLQMCHALLLKIKILK